MRKGSAMGTPTKFAAVGVVNTAVDFLVFSLLYAVLGLPILLANAVAFLTAVTNSYVLNRRWTFRGQSARRSEPATFALYMLISAGGLAVSSIVIVSLATFLHWSLAKIGAIGATFLWNYLLTSRLLFRAGSAERAVAREPGAESQG